MNDSFNRALAFAACEFRGLREAMKYTREIITLITAYRKHRDIIKSTN